MRLTLFPSTQVLSVTRAIGQKDTGVPEATLPLQDLFIRAVVLENDGTEPADLAEVIFELRARGHGLHRRTLLGAALAQRFLVDARLLAQLPPPLLCFVFARRDGMPSPQRCEEAQLLPGGQAVLLFEHLRVATGETLDECHIEVTYRTKGQQSSVSARLPICAVSEPPRYRFPLEGVAYVWNAFDNPHVISHRRLQSQEFALDLVQLPADHRYYPASGALADFACYGARVRSVADGVVVTAVDGVPDTTNDSLNAARTEEHSQRHGAMAALAGNHVVVRHAGQVHSCYCHLRPGSLTVAVGEEVSAGQPVGKIGNSGMSGGPHLHFNLMDGPDLLSAQGLPCFFEGLRHTVWNQPLDGHLLESGWLVEGG